MERYFGAKNAARYAKEKFGVTLKGAERIIRAECAPVKTTKTSTWSSQGMGFCSTGSWNLYSSSEVDRVIGGTR